MSPLPRTTSSWTPGPPQTGLQGKGWGAAGWVAPPAMQKERGSDPRPGWEAHPGDGQVRGAEARAVAPPTCGAGRGEGAGGGAGLRSGLCRPSSAPGPPAGSAASRLPRPQVVPPPPGRRQPQQPQQQQQQQRRRRRPEPAGSDAMGPLREGKVRRTRAGGPWVEGGKTRRRCARSGLGALGIGVPGWQSSQRFLCSALRRLN